MSDTQKQITEATQRILERRSEWEGLEKSARSHESAAKEARLRMDECKTEIAELNKVLGHAKVVSATEEAAAAAVESRKLAEAAKVDQDKQFADKMKELDEKSAKLDALIAKAETPAE